MLEEAGIQPGYAGEGGRDQERDHQEQQRMGQAGLREDQGIDRRQVEADGRWICPISGQRSHLHQMRSRLYSRRGIRSDRVRCTDHSYCPG